MVVVSGSDGELIYVVTDRYQFPDKAGGKKVEHGFQIGKPAESTTTPISATDNALKGVARLNINR